MKRNLLMQGFVVIILTMMGMQASANVENFCFNADVPEAQDNLRAMCLTAPTLFCPQTYVGCPNDNLDPSITGNPTALPGDASCPQPIVSFSDEISMDTPCLKILHRTWSATYPPGSASIKLHSSCQQTLFLEDTANPVINNCPSDIILDLSVSCDSVAIWSVPTAEDDCGIQFFTTTHFSGETFTSGVTPVTYTAQDQCGNVTTCTFNVTVTGSCCSAPLITCPADYVSCPVTGSIDPSSAGVASGSTSDPSCPSASVTFVDNVISTGPCVAEQEIIRTWTVDDGTNSASCDQSISVIDDINPVLSSIPSNIAVAGNGSSCQVAVTWVEPIATDNCAIASLTSSHNIGDLFAEGGTTVTYTATDNCGNSATGSFVVTVTCVCNVPPVLTCPANYTACPNTPSTDPSVTGTATAIAGDANCSVPTINFTDNTISTGPCAGATTIQRIWTATTQNNNNLTVECIQLIEITDNAVPQITNVPQNITLTGVGAGCSAVANWGAPSATDDCGIASLTSNFQSGDVFSQGNTTVTYTAIDNCGNETVQSFNVIVNCQLCETPPAITCPSNFTGCPVDGYPDPSFTGFASAVISGTNCSGTANVTFNDTVNSNGPCSLAYDITRVWTATDPNNSSLNSSCTQTIVVSDDLGPTLTNLPSDITVHGVGANCSIPVKWTDPTATDNCGIANLTSSHNNGDQFSEGTTTVFYTAFDNCGNSASGSFNVTVECTSGCTVPPTISCPTAFTSCAGSMLPSPSVAGAATAAAGSTACPSPFVFFSDFITSFGSCTASYTANRTWTAFDPSNGLTSSCIQVIEIDDNQSPIITNLPSDVTIIVNDASCQSSVTWAIPTATDNCGIGSLSSNFQSGDNFTQGTTAVIYTVTDNCGNSTTASFNVTIQCSAPACIAAPIITCPTNYTACPNGTVPTPSISGFATATANGGCGQPIVLFTDTVVSTGNCSGAAEIQRTWTATEPSNPSLSASCLQTISLLDDIAPVISNIPSNITITSASTSCTAAVNWNIPVANDNCGISSLTSNFQIGDVFGLGTTTVVYTATDNCNNSTTGSFTVTIECATCNTPPNITCPSAYAACPGEPISPSFAGLPTATNNGANCSGIPSMTFVDVNQNNGSCAGAANVIRTWTATDSNTGLFANCTQNIVLEDNSLPTISNVPINITVEGNTSGCAVAAVWTDPIASDNCGIASLISNFQSGHLFSQGTTTVIYTATDNCGNSAQVSFTVTVTCNVCDTPPSLTCPSAIVGCPGSDISPSSTGVPSASINGANCSGTPSLTFTDNVQSNGPCNGATNVIRTWTATDTNNGLSSTCTQNITLQDNGLPVISNIPSNITLEGGVVGCTVPAVWAAPTATDNCGIASLTSNFASGHSFAQGINTVVYTATDNCGNISQASFTVTVSCNVCETPPVISCPDPYTACPTDGNIPGPFVTGFASSFITGPFCSGNPYMTFNDVVIPGSCSGAMNIERTWIATNPLNKLQSSCIQNITLEDNAAPIITNIPQDIIIIEEGINCIGTANWTEPTATDNCGLSSLTSSHTNNGTFGQGVSTVVYTATDNCGNISTASFTVTVQCTAPACTSAPQITCPANFTACPTSPTSTSITGIATASNSNPECTGTIALTFIDNVVSTGPCALAQIVERTWTAFDPNTTLSSSCLQTISIIDNTPPTLLEIPLDITVNGIGGGCNAVVTWSEPFATDDCGPTMALTSNFNSGTAFPEGTTAVVYSVSDNCGNVTTASFNVTIQCEGCANPPVITCPANFTACITGPTDTALTGFASALPGGGCSADPTITFVDNQISTGPCAGAQLIERTWTATDPESGLASSCIQTIEINDTTAPDILNLPSDITVSNVGDKCSAVATWIEPGVTDNCGLATISTTAINGGVYEEGITTVTYIAVDNCGNQSTGTFTITVICEFCDDAPLITCPADYTDCPGSGIPTPSTSGIATGVAGGPFCNDPVITFTDNVISTGPCADSQIIERTWLATDPGYPTQFTSCVQTISLVDNTPPSLANCPINLIIQGMMTTTGSGTGSGMGGGPSICEGVAIWDVPTVSDDCSNVNLVAKDGAGNVVTSGNTFNEGTTVVTYTATDQCGNFATCSFEVVVGCTDPCDTPITISCPPTVSVCIGTDISVGSLGNATATGNTNCDTPVVTHIDTQISSGPCDGQAIYLRTFTASYPGLTSSEQTCTQLITVEDQVPSFVECPETIIVADDQTTVTWSVPILVDPCGTSTVTSTHTPGGTFPCGTTTVTYTATNACGLTETCSFDIIVDCLSNGGFTFCPEDQVLPCNGSGGVVATWEEPIFDSACTDCSNGAAIPGFIYMGSYNGSQYYCSVSPATWPDAKAVCQSNGGFLADVNSPGENSFLANLLTIQSAWIGLSDINSEGNFEWCSGQPVAYTNWYPGQPNNFNGDQDYVELLSTGQWNDQYNSFALEYIMEIPCNSVQQLSGPLNGALLTAGTYTVVYGVADACNSSETCSFTITVEESLQLECPSDIVVTAAPGQTSAQVTWSDPTATSCCSSCSGSIPGFWYMGSFGGHHYYCSIEAATWATAKNTCLANGGNLASISSAAENAFLANILTLQSAWIGGSDLAIEGTFTWCDNTAFNYQNWYPNQPNNFNGQQHTIELLNNGQWNDQYPNVLLEYILEIPDCIDINQTQGLTSGSYFNVGTTTVSYTAEDGCGNTQICSFDVTVEASAGNTICVAGGNSSSSFHIQSVEFGSLINVSGDDTGYGDYTNSCETIEPDQLVPIKLCPGFGSASPQTMFWSVWIDYNHDGDFYDSSEFVAYGAGSNCINGTITIPSGVLNGNTVMRITSSTQGYATDPCGTFAQGETEDYCIEIVNGALEFKGGEITSRSYIDNVEELIEIDDSQALGDAINFNAYPNPVSHILNIDLTNEEAISTLQITDMTGRTVYHSEEISKAMSIDVTGLESGPYQIELRLSNGLVKTERIIVIR